MEIRELFGVGKKFVIGMVHCLPLPGSVGYAGDCEKIYAQAVQDALTLEASGVDAVIVENMGEMCIRDRHNAGCWRNRLPKTGTHAA